jgi:hypothetical protein
MAEQRISKAIFSGFKAPEIINHQCFALLELSINN